MEALKELKELLTENTKRLWLLTSCKKTGWVLDGLALFEAKLKSPLSREYITIDVFFKSKHPYKKIKAACAKDRTVSEMIEFLQSEEREKELSAKKGKSIHE